MPEGNRFPIFCKKFICDNVIKFRKVCFSKGQQKAFGVIFLFFIFLAILRLFRVTPLTKIEKSIKIKRDLSRYEYDNDEGHMEIFKSDIEIIPENRRSTRHPNHRYVEDKLYQNATKGVRMAKPQESKTSKHPNAIQSLILNEKFNGQKATGQNEFVAELLKGLGSSMRLKGVYVQPGTKKSSPVNPFEEKYLYSKEINNLMQTDARGREGKWYTKNAFKNRGAPFQLPDRGKGTPKRKRLLQENLHSHNSLKSQPITIFLDFYPIEEQKTKKFNFESANVAPFETKLYTSMPGNLLHDKKHPPLSRKQNGIIMKLNLHPKNPTFSKYKFVKPRENSHLEYNKKAERKTFDWFFENKNKKKGGKECSSIMGLNPGGKRITAKWKNEKGEWIHAKHVAVKYLKKENE